VKFSKEQIEILKNFLVNEQYVESFLEEILDTLIETDIPEDLYYIIDDWLNVAEVVLADKLTPELLEAVEKIEK